MSNQQKNSTWLERNFGLVVILLLLAGVAAAAFALGYYRSRPVTDLPAMGQTGDYFGGTLNPVFASLAFIALLVSIAIQRIELQATRDELERSRLAMESQVRLMEQQQFELTFFNLLKLHNDVVREFDYMNTKGLTGFIQSYESLMSGYRRQVSWFPGKESATHEIEAFTTGWNEGALRSVFEAYFLRVDTLGGLIVGASDAIERERYTKVLLSQFTTAELNMLATFAVANEADASHTLALLRRDDSIARLVENPVRRLLKPINE